MELRKGLKGYESKDSNEKREALNGPAEIKLCCKRKRRKRLLFSESSSKLLRHCCKCAGKEKEKDKNVNTMEKIRIAQEAQ